MCSDDAVGLPHHHPPTSHHRLAVKRLDFFGHVQFGETLGGFLERVPALGDGHSEDGYPRGRLHVTTPTSAATTPMSLRELVIAVMAVIGCSTFL